MTGQHDLLMRRGPRWAWEQLDGNLDVYNAKLIEVLKALEDLAEVNEQLQIARQEIQVMEPIEKTPGVPIQILRQFESEMRSDSSFKTKVGEDKKLDLGSMLASLNPIHMIKRWV